MKTILQALLILVILSGNSLWAAPQAGDPKLASSIAAIVNKDVITHADVYARCRLVLLTSGMPNNPENLKNIKSQVLKSLIEEAIQRQAALSKKITATPEEVTEALKDLGKQNNMSLEQLIKFLKSHDIPKETLESRIRSNILWIRYIRASHAHSVHVSDMEVAKLLKNIQEAHNRDQYWVGEIFLRVDHPGKENEVLRDAERMVRQLKSKAHFHVLAGQFSQAPSASRGGDIGWVQQGQLADASLEKALAAMQPGEISSPIRTPSGFYILQLKQRRKAGEADPEEAKVTVQQVLIPITNTSSQEQAQQVMEQVEIIKQARNGETMASMARNIGAKTETIKNVSMGQLPEHLRQALHKLPLNTVAKPILMPEGVVLVMLCKREIPKVKLPEREEVAKQLEDQRFTLLAHRTLRDLRSAAFIDIRT
jgi:peptidyl-prolyl cis-trans isomerase SurA